MSVLAQYDYNCNESKGNILESYKSLVSGNNNRRRTIYENTTVLESLDNQSDDLRETLTKKFQYLMDKVVTGSQYKTYKEKFYKLQDFIVVLTLKQEIKIIDKNELKSDSHRVLFKLFPPLFSESQKNRAVKKGLRDVSSDFSEINRRCEDKSNGTIAQLKVLNRKPAMAFYLNDKVEPYRIGGTNSDGKPQAPDECVYYPNVTVCTDAQDSVYLPVYIAFDSIRRISLSAAEFRNIMATLVGKKPKYDAIPTHISKETRDILWNMGLFLQCMALYTNNEKIDTIVVPSSTGDSTKFMREYLLEMFPNLKVVTVRKPRFSDVIEYYKKHKAKYDKIFTDVVVPSYRRSGKTKIADKLSDVFYSKEGELYSIWAPEDSSDSDKPAKETESVIKMAKIPGYFHRKLVGNIMSDYVKDNDKEMIKQLGSVESLGKVMLIDDDVTTGSTLTAFVYPILKQYKLDAVYAFVFFGEGNNPTDKSLGLDYTNARGGM
ncbi:TPA: hypothetical protein SFZ51_001470 [Campylobacter jejuni]|nr:hypothetical protein [Campylobacter jejuni]HEG8105019.1 hypothetical protein [Campylobacter jejuni]HEG8134118.1 hypothetical protein [Campylobacter jejuni]